ncbi:UNVERIFIED_CONTAM: hypothetical protein Sangu_2474100 [Sesamum angustifolium]|uniref:Reverse transcriptase n=1 Tax=Sesamum angustifolium TaxID=2727405 RepID=A0AAW2IPQ4_9LAMI
MIQGFNQGEQRAIGVIRMELLMDDMVSTAFFYVIDVKTSYNMLLGHPWLHENFMVLSTWHQRFKYCRNAGFNPIEKSSLEKLLPEATGKKLHGLDATLIMLKEKGHAIQDSQVRLGFTPPKQVCIAIKRVSKNYATEEFSSTANDKKENPRESIFNWLGPHRRMVYGTTNRESAFTRLAPCKRAVYRNRSMFKVATR